MWRLAARSLSRSSNVVIPIDKAVQGFQESPTLASSRLLAERRAKGLPVFNWGLGASPFSVPPAVHDALVDAAGRKQYAAVEGVPELVTALRNRFSIANPTSKDSSFKVPDGNVLVAPGLKQLLLDAQRVFGGPIVHVAPYWVSYSEQTLLLGKDAVTVQAEADNGYKLTPALVDEACRGRESETCMFLFSHPVNPTGAVYEHDELVALADAFRRHGAVVLADEVYLGCCHGDEAGSIAEYYPELTIRMSSLSKEFGAGGWRLGWALFPEKLSEMKRAMSNVGSSSYSCAPVPQQYAAAAALNDTDGSVAEYSRRCRDVLDKVGQAVIDKFDAAEIPSTGTSVAWYTMIDFEPHREALAKRGITTSGELSRALVQDIGFITVPGEAFGLPPNKLALRVSYVDFDGDEALANPNDLSWATYMLDSIDALNSWITDKQ